VPRIEVTFRLGPDRIMECRAEDLATGAEKRITIAATSHRLSEDEKSRMVHEARERVNNILRQKIAESVVDEARGLVSRAEVLLTGSGGHPLAVDLRSSIQQLNRMLGEGNTTNIENKMDDILRLVTELEAAN
jgi:molecular chaperone DnaK (HSP70)